MRIAIIGAGNVGTAIASGAVRAGHEVVLSATTPQKAARVAAEVGASSAADNVEAARGADVVVLAVPWTAAREITEEIGSTVGNGVVIDATNPLTADYSGLATTDRSFAEELQANAPQLRVVKAFNTVLAAKQATPEADGVRLDGFVAGDDAEAKAQVSGLLESIGYRPVDAGPLNASRALEQMAFLNISMNVANGWPWQSAWKLVGATA